MNTPLKTPKPTPVVGIVGWKKSGKTTLTVKLVEEFTRRGFAVATVKHAHHAFQIDDAETDSARHRRAGAGQVAIVSAKRWAMVTELHDQPEPDLASVLAMLRPCDLVIVEGYKTAAIPKIEARRSLSLSREPLQPNDRFIFAIAADHTVDGAGPMPVFNLDDISGMADLITQKVLAPSLSAPR
jgi:molybdopterin-guanine dinucleotide biosynthesis adapter protein